MRNAGSRSTQLVLVACVLGLAACGGRQAVERRSYVSADDCHQWRHGDFTRSGNLILTNGHADKRLWSVRIEDMFFHGLECALSLDGSDDHRVHMPEGVYYLRVRWRGDYRESERHWFEIRDGRFTLVEATRDGFQPDPRYDRDW